MINLNNEKYARDGDPVDTRCDCPTCRRYSRAYLRHLLKAQEPLALRLLVTHNLYFYNQLLGRIREEIEAGGFGSFRREFSGRLGQRI